MNVISFPSTVSTKCAACNVRNHGICSAVPFKALTELNRISRLVRVPKDSELIRQDDQAHIVGNVVEGILRVSTLFTNGQEQIVSLLFPSDFFGHVHTKRSRFAYQAAVDSTVCVISRLDFEHFIMKHPEVGHQLLATTFREIDTLRRWISLRSWQTAAQRVATFFHMLAQRFPNENSCDTEATENIVVTLPVSRYDIAALVGTTTETLSRTIQALIRRNIIRQINNRQYELLNRPGLLEMAGISDDEHDKERSLRVPLLRH